MTMPTKSSIPYKDVDVFGIPIPVPAYNDKPWFAPAGLKRGFGLFESEYTLEYPEEVEDKVTCMAYDIMSEEPQIK